ncbi:SIR2 family protein [Celeribacter sp.]|uniref:SIR2 family protein n=1 Tax=Celeribacter sp. TaxID=1890673 RepID=UPI003A91C9F5
MSKKLIVFGNGLGRALSPQHFSLENVMPEVWNSNCISDIERGLIAGCIEGIEEGHGPTSEGQLLGAQIAQFGHELISGIVEPDNRGKWFTESALSYPAAVSRYVYSVAKKLNTHSEEFQSNQKLTSFLHHFIPFIFRSKSHIATLNYDTLLYDAFNKDYTVNGKAYRLCTRRYQTTSLVDGFLSSTGFKKENFERNHTNDFGYYLHLHGSPLFVDGNNGPTKLKRNDIEHHAAQNAKHIILSDGQLKGLLIGRSEVLKLYWKMLNEAIKEAHELILFGYGGADPHLNELIKDKTDTKKKYVIEWSGEKGNRKTFWEERLGPSCEVVPIVNILNFREWDDPAMHNFPF